MLIVENNQTRHHLSTCTRLNIMMNNIIINYFNKWLLSNTMLKKLMIVLKCSYNHRRITKGKYCCQGIFSLDNN